MLFTGINYRSLPSARSFSADLNFIDLAYSGSKYDADLSSGIHFGFSVSSDMRQASRKEVLVLYLTPRDYSRREVHEIRV